MKKALVLLMTVAMMLCFSATAFAANFSDMDNATDVVKNAVDKNVAFEIINGYEDGTFKPEATITRAEFAKMACVAAGLKDSGTALGNTTTTFSDVKTGDWYTGWVSLANSKGFVKGYEDGTFKPNQTISYQEVVTVLMRMLGYTDQLAGPWPIDYINQAAKLSVMDDVTFTGTAAAVRGDVAVLVSNTLDCNMVEYSKDKEDFADKTKSQTVKTYTWVYNGKTEKVEKQETGTTTEDREYTLLEESFDGTKVEDALIEDWSVKNFNKNTFNLKTSDGTFEATLDGTVIADGKKIYAINNQIADVFWVKDGSTDVVKYIEITSQSIDGTKISVDGKKVKLDGKTYQPAGDLEAETLVKDATKEGVNVYYTIKVNDDNEVYLAESDYNEDLPKDFQIVKEVKASSEKFDWVGGGSKNLKGKDYIIVKDGKVATFDDVKAGDIVRNRRDDIFEVQTAKTGKLETYGDTKVKIDGVNYLTSKSLAIYDTNYDDLGTVADYLGTEVLYALNSDNSVYTMVAKEEGASGALYGVITRLTLGSDVGGEGNNEVETMTLFTGEGKTVKYDVKSGKAYNKKADEGDTPQVQVGDTIEYKLDSNGVIKSLTKFEQGGSDYVYDKSGEQNDTDKDNNRITIGGSKYTVNDKTIIFNITEDGDDDIDVELMSKSELLSDDVTVGEVLTGVTAPAEKLSYLALKKDGSKALVISGTDINTTSSVKFGVISELNVKNPDDDLTVKFYGDSKYYVIKDELLKTESGKLENVEEKQFVCYSLDGGDINEIKEVKVDSAVFMDYTLALKDSGYLITDYEENDMITLDTEVTLNVVDDEVNRKAQADLTADTIYLEVEFKNAEDNLDVNITEFGTGDKADGEVGEDDYAIVCADDGDATLVIRLVNSTGETK